MQFVYGIGPKDTFMVFRSQLELQWYREGYYIKVSTHCNGIGYCYYMSAQVVKKFGI